MVNEEQVSMSTTTRGLLPCPFCPDGGKPYFTRTVNGTQMAYVGCSQCGIALKCAVVGYGEEAQLTRDIVGAWNTRAPAPQPVLDAGEWELGPSILHQGIEHSQVLRKGIDPFAGGYICIATSADAAQIVRDHRSAAVVPKLVEALHLARKVIVASWDGEPEGLIETTAVLHIDALLREAAVQGRSRDE